MPVWKTQAQIGLFHVYGTNVHSIETPYLILQTLWYTCITILTLTVSKVPSTRKFPKVPITVISEIEVK